MNNDSIEYRLNEIISRLIRIEEKKEKISEFTEKPDCDLIDDFGLDSILMVELTVEIENEFNIEFELEDLNISLLRNYNYLKDYISERCM